MNLWVDNGIRDEFVLDTVGLLRTLNSFNTVTSTCEFAWSAVLVVGLHMIHSKTIGHRWEYMS
jgi:hypothetical protein